MPKSVTIAARVDADLDHELERLAEVTGRRKSWLINEALRSYVANEQQFLASLEMGLEHSRHRSPGNAIVHVLSCLVAYAFRPKKPSIPITSKHLQAYP